MVSSRYLVLTEQPDPANLPDELERGIVLSRIDPAFAQPRGRPKSTCPVPKGRRASRSGVGAPAVITRERFIR